MNTQARQLERIALATEAQALLQLREVQGKNAHIAGDDAVRLAVRCLLSCKVQRDLQANESGLRVVEQEAS